ncbi:MAG: TonB-dependent receptor [Deltaproteobacteria bacterium]|jgi:outer membrane receptor protein involved in Fe transport|nr:TonB-dependent receptor [Deltaproteobacteria bacterium]
MSEAFRKAGRGLILAALAAASASLLPEHPASAQTGGADIGEIEVKSTIRREELQSTSAVVLENRDIIDRVYHTLQHVLMLAPGVSYSEFGQQGTVGTVRIRGFGGGHGGDIGFYYDGIPLNDGGHADNYADTTVLIPLEIESVEIIKGPVSALYGRGNGAGTMAFQGIKRGDITRFQLRYGSYNAMDAQGLIARDDGRLHHVYAFQAFHDDGWQDNTGMNRFNLSTRWTYDVSPEFEVSLNLRAAAGRWDEANMTPSWLDPKGAWDDGSGEGNLNGGHRDRYDARLFANYSLTPESQVSFYTFATKLENNMAYFDGWPGWPGGAPPETGDETGDDQAGRRTAYGTGISYNRQTTVLGWHELSLTIGTDYLREEQKRDQWTTRYPFGNRHFEHFTDTLTRLNTWSLFAETNFQLTRSLKVRLGGRYDRLWGSIETGPDQDGDPNLRAAGKTLQIFSPKIGLLLEPVDWLSLYANYGKGFNIPGINNIQYFTQHQLKPTVREQYEAGFRATPLDWLETGAAVYLADTSNDIQRNPASKGLENAGSTRRQGFEAYARLTPAEDLTIYADYAYQDARTRVNIASPHLEGRRVTSVPRHIFNAEIAYSPPGGLGARARFNWNADMMLRDDPSNPVNPVYRGENYGRLDLQASYRFSEKYKLSLDVLNATGDRPRQGVPNDRGYFLYWAVPPTTVHLTMQMDF